jgi:hypothetical protein
MSSAIKRRLLNLEQNAGIERTAMIEEYQYEIFEAMRFNQEDDKLLDAIAERGEPSTLKEQAALDRFSAEFEAAFKMVASRNRGRN